MKNDDAQLIQQVLAGEQDAFAKLVKKYQKPVHALAGESRRFSHR